MYKIYKIQNYIAKIIASAVIFIGLSSSFANMEVAQQSVVRIITLTSEGSMGTGSGFVINNKQHIVTNYHVIAGADAIMVLQQQGTDIAPLEATLIFQDKVKDIAVLKVDKLDLPALSFAKQVESAVEVWALGYPGIADTALGMKDLNLVKVSTTNGIISRIIQNTWGSNTQSFDIVQHNADINPGNSGGPLLNQCAQVTGVNTAVASTRLKQDLSVDAPQGVFFALHSQEVMTLLKQHNITFHQHNRICLSTTQQLQQTQRQFLAIVFIILFLSLTAVILALRRPRQHVAKVFKNASRLLQKTPAFYLMDQQGNKQLTLQTSKTIVVGRDSALSDWQLEEDTLSRKHAQFFYHNQSWWLEDLNSSNGSFINDKRLTPYQPQALQIHDTIRLGKKRFIFNS